ncbi:MAG: hypothetical protein HY927_11225 [Elusimicrobia bacterium]|nr:hypothetical protein [Elusimicrobiota bacterium]
MTRLSAGVNLPDCPDPFFARELRPLLAALGIKVNARGLPGAGTGLERYGRGAVQVLIPRLLGASGGRAWEAPRRLPMRTVVAPLPLGLEGTCRYMAAIAAAFSMGRAFEAWWRARRPGWERRRRRIVGRASGSRAALVVRAQDAGRLLGREEEGVLPMLRLLWEAGLGVDILCCGLDARALATSSFLVGTPWASETPAVLAVGGGRELGAALARGHYRAVCSAVDLAPGLRPAGAAVMTGESPAFGVEGALDFMESVL